MALFIKTQLIDAEPAMHVILPDGTNEVTSRDAEIPEGAHAYPGYTVRTGYVDELGEHAMFYPADMLDNLCIPIKVNPDLPTDAPSISPEAVDRAISDYEVLTLGDKTTVVRATLWNGFEIVEASSCVSPENYSQEIGAEICMKKIRDKVWMLLGFLLQTAVNAP